MAGKITEISTFLFLIPQMRTAGKLSIDVPVTSFIQMEIVILNASRVSVRNTVAASTRKELM